jgi:phosphatidylglycerophosphatase C
LKTLVLFDFDGTLTKKDSLLHFVKFAVGSFRFYVGLLLLSPTLLGLKMKWIKPQATKEKLIYFYLKGFKKAQLQEIAENYTRTKLLSIFRKTALERLLWHKEQKHEIYVVSASAELWLAAWCKNENIGLIATKLAFDNEKLIKKFATPNCNGEEKVNRIKQEIDLQQFDTIFAYGDTEGDILMLSLAQKPHFQYFKD